MGVDPNTVVKFSTKGPWSTDIFKRPHTNIQYIKNDVHITRREDDFIPGETRRVYKPEQKLSFLEALFEIGSMLLSGMEIHVTLCHTIESLKEGKEDVSDEDGFVPLPDINEEGDIVMPTMEVMPDDEP